MADRYLLESGAPDGYLLEDSSGVLLLEAFELSNSAEGGTDGVTVTTGNSGGASGDAFGFVSGTPTFQDTHPSSGVMGYDTSDAILSWTDAEIPAGHTEFYSRHYIYQETGWGTDSIIQLLTAGGATLVARVYIDSSGFWKTIDGNGATLLTSSSGLSLNTLYRLEYHIISHASAGVVEAKMFVGHSTTPIQTLTSTSVDTDGGDIHWWQTYHNSGSGSKYFVDDIGLTTAGYLGPTGSDAVPGLSTRRRQPHVPMRDLDPWSTTGWRG